MTQDFSALSSNEVPPGCVGSSVSSLPRLTVEAEPAMATGCELTSLRDTAARVVRARHPGADGEDLVQEAWARVALALRDRAIDDPHAYTAGIAANLVRGRYRQDHRWLRRAPLLFMRHTTDAPDGQVVRREEGDALAAALARLPEAARTLLVGHVVDDLSTAALAEQSGTSVGAVAAGLARARAMLRVEYLIAFRHLPDPPERCRRVCYAVSANDARREQRLDAAGHLASCYTCRDLADTLRERRRPAMLGAIMLRLSGWSGRAATLDWQQNGSRVSLVGAGVVGAGVVGAIAIGSVLAPAMSTLKLAPASPPASVNVTAPPRPVGAAVARAGTPDRRGKESSWRRPAAPPPHRAGPAPGAATLPPRPVTMAPLPTVPSIGTVRTVSGMTPAPALVTVPAMVSVRAVSPASPVSGATSVGAALPPPAATTNAGPGSVGVATSLSTGIPAPAP